MIIVKLIGGLGNQMFQYATARSLAEKHSTILKLDLTGFEAYKLHRYSLHCFHIWEYIATHNEIKSIIGDSQNFTNRLKRKVTAKLGFSDGNQNLIREKYFHFDPTILELKDNVLIDGFWQSEKYFADIPDILRREFDVKYKQDPDSKEFSELIQSNESISIHVRRADYVQNQVTNQVHGTCDRAYYDRCVNHIEARVSNPHFFIFSDEPEWARENLKLSHPTTIVDCNDPSRNYEDLRLMSQCQHNIIANSSFSWWGAWLNSNPNKIVCAPEKWFNDPTRDTKDLIPNVWIKL